MELNKVNPKFTGQEMIEKLQDENKYLRESIVEEKIKSEGNIRALNKALIEVKEDNSNLSRQIEDYIELKDHYSNLKHQGII
jgi:Tfp pilus assembly protein PilO